MRALDDIIKAYDGDETDPALVPGVQTYDDAGVDGVTAGNLDAINSAVALLPVSNKPPLQPRLSRAKRVSSWSQM